MADTPYTQGFRAGVAYAEKRIIKLLDEAKTYQQLELAIEKIKGGKE